MALLKAVLKPISAVAGKVVGEMIYNGKPVTQDLQKKRLWWCNDCIMLTKTGQCKKCLCFVEQKVKYDNQKCPMGKW